METGGIELAGREPDTRTATCTLRAASGWSRPNGTAATGPPWARDFLGDAIPARYLATTFLPRYGAQVIYGGDGSTSLVAEQGQAWDAVLLVRYPSREVFSHRVADPQYQQVTHLRTKAALQATVPWDTPTVG